MPLKFYLLFGLIILSCFNNSKLKLIKDDFNNSTTYILDNNILNTYDDTHLVELNLQQSISENGPYYLLIIECLGSNEIGINDSTNITFMLDGIKYKFIPNNAKVKYDIDPDLIYEEMNFLTEFNFIKKIAYSHNAILKIYGNRKIIHSQLNLKNKLNFQNFIETFIPLSEQMQ